MSVEFKKSLLRDFNGLEIILDADGDTSITADTDDQIDIKLAGSDELILTAAALYPYADGGLALGITNTNQWAHLYLDDVGVINWNNGDVTLTHASNKVTLGGGDFYLENGRGMVIGHTAQITGDNRAELQVVGTSDPCSSMMLGRWSNDASNPVLQFVKSHPTDGAITNTIVIDNDAIGSIRWMPADGTDYATRAAIFVAEVDDPSPVAGGVGMAFVWQQMPGDGTSAARETMRLAADGTLSLAVGDLDLNNNDLLNVGNAGNDWTSTTFSMDHAQAGTLLWTLRNTTGSNTSAAATIRAVVAGGSGDAAFRASVDSNEWQWGVDNSASDGFALSFSTTLGSNDALRITGATPPVMTYNATHPTGTFDYVCEVCGKHDANTFTCCGPVAWHDDVMDFRAMVTQDETAIDYMAKIGVLERTYDNDGNPEVFTVLGQDWMFVGSMAYQNRVRMDAQYEELNHRLQAIGA